MTKKKNKPSVVEIIPSTDAINLDFRSIVAGEASRLKEMSQKAGLSTEGYSNLRSLASTYKTVETELRDQQQADSLNRLTQQELLELAFKVINSLPEKDKKDFILQLVSSNQRLLT